MKRRRVGVLMGGRSSEREVSLQSGAAVLQALRDRGWDAYGIDVGTDPCRQIVASAVDLAFVALHGRFGEDGCMQGLLESIGLPYTGAGVLASAMAMDKVISKRLFDAAGLPTPSWVYPVTVEGVERLGLPAVLKPRAEGSSVGLAVVRDSQQLQQTLADVERAGGLGSLVAERYISGHELSVAVLGAGSSARALGSVEIRPVEGVYDYQAKYERDDTQYLVPAPLPSPILARMETLAVAAHRLLECSGATRVDFRWTGDEGQEPVLLEVNTLPGMTSHSLLPKIAAHCGLSYGELVETIALDARLKA